jgi:predicted Zn-dependent protease
MKRQYLLLGLIFLVSFSACKKEDKTIDYETVDNFYKKVSTIEVEVAYEPGAEPYTTLTNGDNIWQFTQTNVEALFDGRPVSVSVTVPPNLASMQQIPDQNRDNYSAHDVMNLATRFREGVNTQTSGNLWVVFLDGYFKDGDSLRTNVLGVNITGTSVTAVFKPVINGVGALTSQRKYIEQSTVVHELGHALGLVNSGLPETSNHTDTDHGGHCTNQDCVMYWLNEGAVNLSNFVSQNGMSQFTVVFGPECLQDTRSFFP